MAASPNSSASSDPPPGRDAMTSHPPVSLNPHPGSEIVAPLPHFFVSKAIELAYSWSFLRALALLGHSLTRSRMFA